MRFLADHPTADRHFYTRVSLVEPGEVIEVEIVGIGICANPIVAEQTLITGNSGL